APRFLFGGGEALGVVFSKLFNRINARLERLRGPQVIFVKADFVGDDLALGVADAADFQAQAAQDIADAILFAAAKDAFLVGFHVRVRGQRHLALDARLIAKGE